MSALAIIKVLYIALLTALITASPFEQTLQPARRISSIDQTKHISALQAAGLVNQTDLKFTDWPRTPYRVDFPNSHTRCLIFTELNDSGSAIQSTALVALVSILVGRIAIQYPDTSYNIVAAVPDIGGVGLTSFSLEIKYETPSQGDLAREASTDALNTLGQQVGEHGIKDLDAILQLSDRNVGNLQIFTEQHPLPISRNHLPIIVAISWARGPAIEITKLRDPYGAEVVDVLFEAVGAAFDKVSARPALDGFELVYAEGVAAEIGKVAKFSLRSRDKLLNNAAATAVVAAFSNFLVDIEPGYTEFDIFSTEPSYARLARGELWVDDVRSSGANVIEKPGVGSFETA